MTVKRFLILRTLPICLLQACGPISSPKTGESGADTAEASGTGEPVPFTRDPTLPQLDGFVMPMDRYERLADSFGMRALSLEDDRPDFHRGVDFVGATGDPIYSVGDGVVHRVRPEDVEAESSAYLIVKHTLVSPVAFHGEEVEEVYSFYAHLSAFEVEEGDTVEAGELIARVGTSGGVETPHLHLEIRLGSWCSLEYQLEDPTSSCAVGYDPAVHPFHAVPLGEAGGMSVLVSEEGAYTLTITSDREDIDLNRVETDLGAFDFDTREGLDASSEERLDETDLGWVQLEPSPLLPDDPTAVLTLGFPTRPAWVEVSDIYGVGWRLGGSESRDSDR